MAYERDVESIDAIVNATYEVLSGPAGPKDWARERFLLHPTGRMMRGLPAGGPTGDCVSSRENTRKNHLKIPMGPRVLFPSAFAA